MWCKIRQIAQISNFLFSWIFIVSTCIKLISSLLCLKKLKMYFTQVLIYNVFLRNA